jgi:hypothetical protein
MCYKIFECPQENEFTKGMDEVGPTGPEYSNKATIPKITELKRDGKKINSNK